MKKNLLLSLSSAFLLWLAWPPMPFTAVLLLVALVPLLFALQNVHESADGKKGRRTFQLAFLCFFVWNTASIYWVFNSLNAVMPAGVALLIAQIPFCLGAVLMTAAFWLYSRLKGLTGPLATYIALICFWVAYEFLHQTWDLAFPWMNLGNGFAQMHYLVQWYEFTGVYGGTVWILVCNILIFEILKRWGIWKSQLIISAAAVILVPIAASLFMYFTYTEAENPSNVVVVQPNVDPYNKFDVMQAPAQIQRLIELSDSVAAPNTEFFIWPETAISTLTDEKLIREQYSFQTIQRFLTKYRNGNVISGIESYSTYDTAQTPTARHDSRTGLFYDVFNAAVLIENSPKVQFYHKSRLVPGVEKTPFAILSFLKPVFAAFGGSTGGFGYQEEPSVFYSQSGIGAAPVICYESIWGEYVAEYVRKDAQFIAIITNDGWWGNTSGKDQHLQYAKLRAIETRRWVARSANTGISAFINQRGDVVQETTWWRPDALKADINLNDELTFYVRSGDYFAKAGTFASIGFLILLIYLGYRNKKRSAG